MKRLLVMVVMLFAMFAVCTPAFAASTQAPAQTEQSLKVEVDLGKMPENVRNAIIDNMNPADTSADGDIVTRVLENPSEMVGYMNEFASGLKEVCDVLSIEVNEFVKTPVGALTTGIVVYNMLDGKDVVEYFKELLLLLPLSLIGWYILLKYIKRVTQGYVRKMPIYDENGKKTKSVKSEFVEPTWSNFNGDEQNAVLMIFILVAFVLAVCTGVAVL